MIQGQLVAAPNSDEGKWSVNPDGTLTYTPNLPPPERPDREHGPGLPIVEGPTTIKGNRVVPNASYQDPFGKIHEAYLDNRGWLWLLEERRGTGVDTPDYFADIKVQDWEDRINQLIDEELNEEEGELQGEAGRLERIDLAESYQEWQYFLTQKNIRRLQHLRDAFMKHKRKNLDTDILLSPPSAVRPPITILEDSVRMPTPQGSPQSFNALLKQMQKDMKANAGDDNAGKPWGYTIFESSTLGPGNDLPHYQVAVQEGPLSEAAWRHDYMIGATRDSRIRQWADEVFKQDFETYLQQNPDFPKSKEMLIRQGIRMMPFYYAMRDVLSLDKKRLRVLDLEDFRNRKK